MQGGDHLAGSFPAIAEPLSNWSGPLQRTDVSTGRGLGSRTGNDRQGDFVLTYELRTKVESSTTEPGPQRLGNGVYQHTDDLSLVCLQRGRNAVKDQTKPLGYSSAVSRLDRPGKFFGLVHSSRKRCWRPSRTQERGRGRGRGLRRARGGRAVAASDGSLAALLDDVFARHKLEGAVVTRTSNTILDAVCTGRPRFVTSHSSTQALQDPEVNSYCPNCALETGAGSPGASTEGYGERCQVALPASMRGSVARQPCRLVPQAVR